jgi:hypothetical protein
MNAAVEADDELREIARRLEAGPEEFLTSRLLSPAEELSLRQQSEVREAERSQPKTPRNGLQRLVDAVFSKDHPQPTGVDEDLKVLWVQEFLTQRRGLGRSSSP